MAGLGRMRAAKLRPSPTDPLQAVDWSESESQGAPKPLRGGSRLISNRLDFYPGAETMFFPCNVDRDGLLSRKNSP